MPRPARIALGCALTLVLVAVAPTSLAAQEMATGTWSGSIQDPDGDGVDVSFEVSGEGETLAILVVVAEMGMEMAFEDVALSDGELTFTFFPGELVSCVLEMQEDGAYSGECVDGDGDVGIVTMVPPDDG